MVKQALRVAVVVLVAFGGLCGCAPTGEMSSQTTVRETVSAHGQAQPTQAQSTALLTHDPDDHASWYH